MDPRITSAAQQFAVSASRVSKAIGGLSEAALLARPNPETNSMLWLLGHVASTRVSLMRMLGVDRPLPFDGRFGKGAEPDGNLPSAAEVLAVWEEVQKSLPAELESAAADTLSGPSPRTFPIEDQTVAGCVVFLAFHEAYHLGQLGYLRKAHDGQQLSG